MVTADGSFKGCRGIRLGFSNGRKGVRCRQLRQAAGIAYAERQQVGASGDAAVSTFVIADRGVRERLLRLVSADKDLSWDCLTQRDGQVYLEEAAHGDSHRLGGGRPARVPFHPTPHPEAPVMRAPACTP